MHRVLGFRVLGFWGLGFRGLRKLQVGSLGYIGLLEGFYIKVYRPSIRLP